MAFSINWTDFAEPWDSFVSGNSTDELSKADIFPSLPTFLDFTEQKSNHIFIQGDNYPCLSILTKNFSSKVDFIYIDPPYNTGKSFTYNDKFSTLNAEDLHSAWLSFMERRLKLAHKLLKDSGCIFIAIGTEELYVLKLLCDKIFGEENFVNDFMWLVGKAKKDSWSRTMEQHTLCFAKNKKQLKPFCQIEYSDWAKTNVDNDPRGNWFSGSISFTENRSNKKHKNFYKITSPSGVVWERQWLVTKEEMEKLLQEDKIFFGKAPEFSGVPRVKIFNNSESYIIPKNIIDFVDSTKQAQNYVDSLLGEKNVFDNPKPVSLIKHLIKISQMPDDAIILDFFAGSGTTFEAVCELNNEDSGARRCILIQKEEKTGKNSSFETISKLSFARCKKVQEKFNEPIDFFELKNVNAN